MASRFPTRVAPPPPPIRKGSVQAFEAISSYKAKRPTELSFEEGDLLYVMDQSDANWWIARQDKKEGFIPSNHVSKENVRIHIIDAARRGNLTLLIECLNNGISVNSLDKTGSSALHAACMSGHLDCVQRLLQEPKIELNLQNKLGDTALHNAAIKGHSEICQMLIEHGALKNLENIEKQTPKTLARSSVVKGIFDKFELGNGRSSHLADDCEDYDDDSDDDGVA